MLLNKIQSEVAKVAPKKPKCFRKKQKTKQKQIKRWSKTDYSVDYGEHQKEESTRCLTFCRFCRFGSVYSEK